MTDPITLPESKIRLDGGPNAYAAMLAPVGRKSGLAQKPDGTWCAWLKGQPPEFFGTREECVAWLDERAIEMQMGRRSS